MAANEEDDVPLDPSCVKELCEKHNDSLINLLRARLRSSEDAKDVAQDTYERLLRHGMPQTIRNLDALLFKTARNLAFDRIRERSTHSRLDRTREFDEVDLRSPEVICASEQEAQVVREAISELPYRDHMVLLMQTYQDLSLSEIAKEVGRHDRTVERWSSRGKANLRSNPKLWKLRVKV